MKWVLVISLFFVCALYAQAPSKLSIKEDNISIKVDKGVYRDKTDTTLQKQMIKSLRQEMNIKIQFLMNYIPKGKIITKYVKVLVPIYIPEIDSSAYAGSYPDDTSLIKYEEVGS